MQGWWNRETGIGVRPVALLKYMERERSFGGSEVDFNPILLVTMQSAPLPTLINFVRLAGRTLLFISLELATIPITRMKAASGQASINRSIDTRLGTRNSA